MEGGEGDGGEGASLADPNDPKVRHFKEECEAVLTTFERAHEWADLIRYLQRLQRTLNK